MIWVKRKDGAWARSTAPDFRSMADKGLSPRERLLELLPFLSLKAAVELAEVYDEGPEDAPVMGPDDMAEWIFEIEDEDDG